MAEPDPHSQSDSHSLLLLRHAKSAWPEGVADLDRPLARRGERAAELVGHFLADHGLVPDRVVSSPARRAADTAARVLTAAGGTAVALPVDVDRRLYDGDARAAVLEHLGGARRLLVVGHEPDLVDVVRVLSGAEVRMPTGGLVWLEVGDLGLGRSEGPAAATVRLVLPPKLLDARPA